MTGRLTSQMLVSALIRRVNQAGGMAMVLAKGDETAGGLLLATREKGGNTGLFERLLGPQGDYQWQGTGPQDMDDEAALTHYIQNRRDKDPDLWVIELDIANAERFAAELTATT